MTSQEYWRQREAAQRKRNIADEAEYQRELRRIYAGMMDNIQKEIDSFYARYAAKEGITLAEAKRRAAQLDIDAYARKAKKYVKERDFSDTANEEMRLYNLTMKVNRLELLKANIGLELVGGFDELQKYFDRTLTDRTMEEFRRQAGILGKSVQNNQKYAHAIVNASFHNAKFSDRIWMHQDLLRAEIGKQLQIGLIQGRSSRELARAIRDKFNASRSDAERLMTTELRRVQTEAARQSYERNGNEDYTFLVTNPKGPCPVCAALDGKHFKVADMEIGVNAPPMHPRCHCTTAPYWDQEAFDRWLDEENRKMHERMEGGETAQWNQTSNLPVQIGGCACRVTNRRYGFGNGTYKGIKKTVDAVIYTTPDGTNFVFPKSYNKKRQQMTPEKAISLWQKVPKSIRAQAQNTIEFVDYYNPQDAVWRKRYKNFGHSYATGGDKITFYRYDYPHDDDYVVRTYCHEAGHLIDTKKSTQSRRFSEEAMWTRAMAKDIIVSGKKSCTSYGENTNAEDFAESVAEYVKDRKAFEKEFPNRAKILSGFI